MGTNDFFGESTKSTAELNTDEKQIVSQKLADLKARSSEQIGLHFTIFAEKQPKLALPLLQLLLGDNSIKAKFQQDNAGLLIIATSSADYLATVQQSEIYKKCSDDQRHVIDDISLLHTPALGQCCH